MRKRLYVNDESEVKEKSARRFFSQAVQLVGERDDASIREISLFPAFPRRLTQALDAPLKLADG